MEHRLTTGCAARAALGAALVAAAAACGENVQPTYDLTIATPVGADPFATAAVVQLRVGGSEPVQVRPTPGRPFQLSLSGIDVSQTSYAPLSVAGFDTEGRTIAYGRTPPVELVRNSIPLSVFVQRPATLGRLPNDADPPVADGFAVAVPVPMNGALRATTTIVWGLGDRYVPVATNQLGTVLDDETYVFDSYVQQQLVGPVELGLTARAAPAAVALESGKVVVFGGFTAVERRSSGPWALARLERFTLSRAGFSFDVNAAQPGVDATDPAIARGRTRLVAIGNDVYAFGGEGDAGVLSSIVRIEGEAAAGVTPFQALPVALSAPRIGHTATLVVGRLSDGRSTNEVLVFGGAAAGQRVADVFVPGSPATVLEPSGDPGPPRRDHRALRLPDGTVLIVGGRDAEGRPLATSVRYDPVARSFLPGPVTLATPRADAAAFLIGNDLVVAGGWGPGGALLADAEIFDAAGMTTFAAVGVSAAVARAGAEALPQPNDAILVFGGWEQDATGALHPSGAFEIYQPRR